MITKDDILETKPISSVANAKIIMNERNEARLKLASKISDELASIREALKKYEQQDMSGSKISTLVRAHIWLNELEKALRTKEEKK